MDRGFEQFIIVAIIIIAALLDLLVRSLKRKRDQGSPGEQRDEPVLVEDVEDSEDVPDWWEREPIDAPPERPRDREAERQPELQRERRPEPQPERRPELEPERRPEPQPERRPEPRPDRPPARPTRPPPPVRTAPPRSADVVLATPRVSVPLDRSPPSPLPHAGRPVRRRRRARGWVSNPADARRGIVLMTILGPCRALEPPRRDG